MGPDIIDETARFIQLGRAFNEIVGQIELCDSPDERKLLSERLRTISSQARQLSSGLPSSA
jgi:hypothetical protein